MSTRKLLVLSAVAVCGWAGEAMALDSPHDGSFATSVAECQSCHKLHGGGGTLTNFSSNNDACLTCHDSASVTPNHFFSPAWSSAGREAVPGTGGDQHKWSGSPTNLGARIPTSPAMAKYLSAGATLQCAVCHDAHGAKDATGVPVQDQYAPNSIHASYKLNVPQPPVAGGAGRMKLISVTDGGYNALPAGYAVRVKSAGLLEISHNIGTTTPTWASSIPFTVGDTAAQNVWLDDPSVVVRITAAPAVGDLWQFYVSFPLLRATNVADAMCVDCHADRVQSHDCVEGVTCTADGTKVFSHPVAEGLNANAKGYDLAAPLDADGTVGSSTTDGAGGVPNPGNDLKLVGGVVRCTTCHAPHNAASNSLSVEVR
jgi:predicted CXXCH cytochrome family protein